MVESNHLRLPFWEPWFWEASIINIDGEVCFRQFWGFHFGNPNVEEPNLSRLWALKECCVFCSCIGLDFGPGKTLVILLNEKTKTPATSISLTCIGLIFRLGELSALYIYILANFKKCCSSLLPVVLPTLHKNCLKLLVAWGAAHHPSNSLSLQSAKMKRNN